MIVRLIGLRFRVRVAVFAGRVRVRMTVVVVWSPGPSRRWLVVRMGVRVGMPVRAVIRHGDRSFPPDSSSFGADSRLPPLQQHERLPGGLGSDERLHHPTARLLDRVAHRVARQVVVPLHQRVDQRRVMIRLGL